MSNSENEYKAWWEGSSSWVFIGQFLKRPRVVVRQIEVACDMSQAPVGSDHETFPTLSPEEAEKFIRKQNL